MWRRYDDNHKTTIQLSWAVNIWRYIAHPYSWQGPDHLHTYWGEGEYPFVRLHCRECPFMDSGTLRIGTGSCARAAQYHTNTIVVSDFTIATRKWAKLCKLSHTICYALRKCYTFPCRREACWGCMRFTTRDFTVGVFCKLFQTHTDFMRLYR